MLTGTLCVLALVASSTARASDMRTPARSALVYDTEYPYIGYSDRPRLNDIARLEDRMVRNDGEDKKKKKKQTASAAEDGE